MPAPFYIVFAGVNGAGKSTFYQSGLWRIEGMPKKMARVNPDEIARGKPGATDEKASNFEAGRMALQRIEGLFEKRRSFNQETTLSGRMAFKNIERAHKLGYRIFMYYIGVDNAQTAIRRVEHRVALGGHDISPEAIARRYNASLSALARSLDYCEQITVFDNTIDFSCLAIWARGTLAWWGGSACASNWLTNAITNDDIWKRP